MSYLALRSNTLREVAQELMVQSLGSLNLIKGYAEGDLAVVFCEELDIASLLCALTQQVWEGSLLFAYWGHEESELTL